MKTWKLYTVKHRNLPEVCYELLARDSKHLFTFLEHVQVSWVYWYSKLVYNTISTLEDFLVGEFGTQTVQNTQKNVKVLSSRLSNYSLPTQNVRRSQREEIRETRAKVAKWVVGSSAYGMATPASDVDTFTLVHNTWSEKNGLATFPRSQGDNSVYDLLSASLLMKYSWKHYGDVATEPVEVFDSHTTNSFLQSVGGVTSTLLQRALQLMYAYQGGQGESRMEISPKGWAHSLRVAFELAYCATGKRLQHPLFGVKKYCYGVRMGKYSMVDAAYIQAEILASLSGQYAWLANSV